jgi:uncharacterized protein (DUF433 family)
MIMPPASAPQPEDVSAITPNEAAWLTELSTKTINATIDRGELGVGKARRRSAGRRVPRILAPADVMYLALRKEVAELLSPRAKTELYEQLVQRQRDQAARPGRVSEPQGDIEIVLSGGVVRIEVKSTYRRLAKRWAALRDAKKLVVSNPEIRGGEPVIRDTRVPVYLIADLVRQGAGLKEILEDFPSLNASKVRSALAYAQTHPKRGRPKKAPWKE